MPALLDPRRTVAAMVAVAMSAVLIVFSFIVSDSFRAQLTADAWASVGKADVVAEASATADEGVFPEQAVRDVSQANGVAAVRPQIQRQMWGIPPGANSADVFSLFVLDVPEVSGGTRLTSGRLPESAQEVAVSSTFAQQYSLEVGSTTTLAQGPRGGPARTTTTVTVVGIIQPSAEVAADVNSVPLVFATAEARAALGVPEGPAFLYITARPGISPEELREAVTEALQATQADAQVSTAADVVTWRASTSGGGATSTAFLLLRLLTPVCAVVAGIVIATTFTTLVARQTHQIGLTRCVGASRRQVMGSVLRTGLLSGVVGSVAGAAAGAVVAATVVRSGVVEGLEAEHLTVSWRSFALAVLIGTVVTLVSVLRPARQATRVSPLVALTGQTADTSALGRRRVAVAAAGVLIALVGCGLIWQGVTARVLEYITAGAVVTVLGVIASLPLLVVGASRLAEVLSGRSRRPVLQLAARNLARNPGRAAATAASLLVSVAVAATLATGLSSVDASMEGYLASGSPVDIRVEGITAERDATALVSQVEAVEGVEATTLVPRIEAQVTSSTAESGSSAEDPEDPEGAGDPDDSSMTLDVIDRDAITPVIRSDQGLEGLDDHTLIIGGIYGLEDGSAITLSGPAGSAELTVHVSEEAGTVVTPAVAQQLAGDAPTSVSLWARASGDGSDQAPATAVRQALAGSGLLVVTSAEGRASFTQMVQQVTVVIGGVLVFTLLIALSGMANTASVGVLERTREIGVLRATGTQRAEVRRLFLTEGLLTALLGGAIGILLGCTVGIAGSAALLNSDSGDNLVIQVPWLVLAGAFLAAAAVGVLATWRPAEAASRVPPVLALAQD
ncbi:ABC transporter permease [Actinomyces lilanjuaniae]|uniref:ABC transporter permease n=1 Tax=Actinomyces lilanjuaniae TaxID=2321394 RepID=A0ABN5PLL4_9ACTO|nr:ABC transporter permease [Actinomyces lilanjuaniae]AYD89230.1 ABC transporter permease [Actinomyces lilanjuaniae]